MFALQLRTQLHLREKVDECTLDPPGSSQIERMDNLKNVRKNRQIGKFFSAQLPRKAIVNVYFCKLKLNMSLPVKKNPN